MKRTLSIILAALLLASSMVSCGTGGSGNAKETTAETTANETSVTDTAEADTSAADPSVSDPIDETDAPESVPYDTSLITENGVAKAHIVLPEGASADEKTAADELVYHIKLVTGADITVTNSAMDDSLPIIIATPDSLPELEKLFPEDLAWLRTIGKVGDMERYGEDGFAIRTYENKIYIFGAVPRGALNGTYDFIEENLDLIWIRNDNSGIMYEEMPTVNVVKVDYREKSPFQIRYNGGFSKRNKYESVSRPAGSIHTVKSQVLRSPIYDPNNNEYWETNTDGKHYDAADSNQVNYWSQLTADAVAATVIAELDKYDDASRPKFINVCEEDFGWTCGVYPEQTLPFEYAPGQFVEPSDRAYISTVFFTFINRVARQVAEKYPDVTVNTLVYDIATDIPVCDIDDNVSIWFCPTVEDYTQPGFSVALEEAANGSIREAALEAVQYEKWVEKHPNIMLYTYYFTQMAVGWYERPIWYRMQDDFRYFAATGNLGLRVEVQTEGSDALYGLNTKDGGITESLVQYTNDQARRMNLLSYWLFQKLAWDPNEDVDALIVKFCDKVYGDASDEMQEYYSILYKGWSYSAEEILPYEFNSGINWGRDQEYYYIYFLDIETDDGVYIIDALTEALTKAWEAADEKVKEFIRWPYECYTTKWKKLF